MEHPRLPLGLQAERQLLHLLLGLGIIVLAQADHLGFLWIRHHLDIAPIVDLENALLDEALDLINLGLVGLILSNLLLHLRHQLLHLVQLGQFPFNICLLLFLLQLVQLDLRLRPPSLRRRLHQAVADTLVDYSMIKQY